MSDTTDPFAAFAAAQRSRIEAHAAMRDTEPFKAALGRIDRLVMDYGVAINAIHVMATRWPPFFERLITLRLKQQFVESAVATAQAITEGLYNPARRELRFMLEASIKTFWLDSGCPKIGEAKTDVPLSLHDSVDEKVGFLDDLGRERFGELVASLGFNLIDGAGANAFRQMASSLYSRLSTHVHVSSQTISRELKSFDRGRNFGFETVADVNAIADLMRQVFDIALASHLEAFDAGLVGDLFTQLLDEKKRWTFHKTPLVAAVSRRFNYKVERQPGSIQPLE